MQTICSSFPLSFFLHLFKLLSIILLGALNIIGDASQYTEYFLVKNWDFGNLNSTNLQC